MNSVKSTSGIAGVVLAAGRSTRMRGINKLLVPVCGVPAIVRVCSVTLDTELSPVIVVLGHQASEVRAVVRKGCDPLAGRMRFLFNAKYREGRLSSVAAALEALDESIEAAVFLRGDQPWVTARLVGDLLAAYRGSGAALAFPVHKGCKGSPTVVGRDHFHRFLALRGDHGTLGLAEELWDDAEKLEVEDPRCLMGIDTPDDLADICPE